MTNLHKIINYLKKSLENDPDVLALVLVGSQARKDIYKADKYSDLEAYIVVGDENVPIFEKQLPDLAKSLGNVLFSFKHTIGYVAVYDDLFRIELPVVKQSDMASIFNRPKAQTVKVLIDKTNGQLGKILSQRPDTINYEELFQNIVINFWYWQIIGVEYFKKGEIYNARAILNIHSSALIKLFELLNNPAVLLLETNKRVEQFLTQDQLKLLKQITVKYDLVEIKQALLKVMDIFADTVMQIKNKYGWIFDGYIEEKIKPKILGLLN